MIAGSLYYTNNNENNTYYDYSQNAPIDVEKAINEGMIAENGSEGKVLASYTEETKEETKEEPEQIEKEEITKTSLEYLNSPYLWGGNSPYGIDCSGLTQMSYALHGIQIPRDACDQATIGETVSFLAEAEPGDLIYFDNSEAVITHVGILLPNNKIIHASGHVRIDSIDHQGIYRADMSKYTHKLRIIKKLF